MRKIIAIIILLAMINLVIAVEKPVSDSVFAISQPDALSMGLAGQKCYKDYSTMGEYCSVNIREYYQCLPRIGGSEWVFKSENCGDYGYKCIMEDGKGKCVSPTSLEGLPWMTIGIIAVVVLLLYLSTRKK